MTYVFNHKKTLIKVITVFVVLLLLASVSLFIFGNKGVSAGRDPSRIGGIVKADGIQISDSSVNIAENDRYILDFNGSDCSFAVEDKITGSIWHSNPPDSLTEDFGLNESTAIALNSQLSIRYMNGIQQETVMDSATYSIALRQYTAQKIDDGVSVLYSFAYPDSDEIFPRALSTVRYEEIVNSLSYSADKSLMKKMYALIARNKQNETDLEKLIERYGALAETDIYILRDGQLNTANRKKLTVLFSSIDYSKEQLKTDLVEVKFTGTSGSGESYTIPVKYILEEDGLRVSIDCKEIRYTETDAGFLPLISIDLLDYFGCATQDEEGYLLVPDGSGSLIGFKERNNRNTTLEGRIYGNDPAILSTGDSGASENFTMPVYGIIKESTSMLAVIEEGEAMARIRTNTGGDGIPLNRIGISFDTMSRDYIPIGETATRENFYVYSNDIYKGRFTVKYYFFSGEESTIPGMAEAYRKNLIARGKLSKTITGSTPSAVLELQGAIDVVKTFAGIPYKSTMALTDFDAVKRITDTLTDAGLTNPVIHYAGVYKGGYKTGIQNKFSTDKSLGSSKTLNDLTAYMDDKGFQLYFSADFYKIYKESLFSPFHKKTDAVRNLTREISKKNSAYLLSPNRIGDIMGSYINGAVDNGVHAIAPVGMGEYLYSDFNPNNPISRQDSLTGIQASLKESRSKNIRLLADGANSYLLEFADIVTDVPYDDSNYIISDHSIPFYQMIIHGFIDYCGEPINYDSEPVDAVLKSVMTGSILSYRLIGEPSYVLNDTDYSDLYAPGFDDWKDEIILWNTTTADFFAEIREKKMTGFDILSKNVYLTTFENLQVVVNLSDSSYNYEGVIIKGKDFYWFEESAQ